MNETPDSVKTCSVRDVLDAPAPGARVEVCGWVRTRRDAKSGFSFVELNDGSCLANLQVIAEAELSNYESEIRRLQPGSSIAVRGVVTASPGAGQQVELHAHAITVHGDCDITQYPLQKKRISFEKLREYSHLRARTNTFGAVARVRNTLSFGVHSFFQERGFYYLTAPIITTSDCEGAGQMFQVTTLDPEHPPRGDDGKIDFSRDFFGRPASLTVSGQLEAETYACALSKVYTFGPTFRAEDSNTSRHLAEFWMIEPEIAFAGLEENAVLAEEFLKDLFRRALEKDAADLELFNKWVDKTLIETLTRIVDVDFVRLTYTDAVDILRKAKQEFEFPVEWGLDLQSEHERFLTETAFEAPVIVTDFPKAIKPFYMRVNDDDRTVAAMDVLVPKVGEIIGGSQREERLDVLQRRLAECGLDESAYWWYLDLRRFGTVPHAGFGLGFERLVQFVTGMANIRDVIPYPRTPGHAEF